MILNFEILWNHFKEFKSLVLQCPDLQITDLYTGKRIKEILFSETLKSYFPKT